jgi:UDP-N-acetylglucosamine:LPS N-acetylglucosamine transferase
MAMKKVVAVASAGGHWIQLMRLTPSWEGLDIRYMTTARGMQPQRQGPVHVVSDANRWERLKTIKMFCEVGKVLLQHRPNVVITTGAAPGLAAVIIGRLLGARTIWIDSIANGEEISGSGKVARRFASLYLTQWEHLAKPGGAQHWGSVL